MEELVLDEEKFLREVKDNLKALFKREDYPLHKDYNLQSTDDKKHFLGHDDSNCFTPLIASSPNVKKIRWRYVYYEMPGPIPIFGGVFYTSPKRSRTFWHFNNLQRNGNVGLVTGDSSLASDPSNLFTIVNLDTPRNILPYHYQQWYVQFDPSMIQPTLPATKSKTAVYIGFDVTVV